MLTSWCSYTALTKVPCVVIFFPFVFWNWFWIPLAHISPLDSCSPNAVLLSGVALLLCCTYSILIFETHLLSFQSHLLPSHHYILERSVWSLGQLLSSPFSHPFQLLFSEALAAIQNHTGNLYFFLETLVKPKLLPCLVFCFAFILPASIFPSL